MKKRLIKEDKGIVVAADVESTKQLNKLVESTCNVNGIVAYKVGSLLGLKLGLPGAVGIIKQHTDLPVIYDHQKAGTDIPNLGQGFAEVVADAGAEAVILFPFGGVETEERWIEACQAEELTVLVGGHMTQSKFLQSEDGFIADTGPGDMYIIAAEKGVRDFVFPGNKIEFVREYKKLLEGRLGKGNFDVYAPGFITQGGIISEFAKAAGNRWRAIVGSAIYKASDMEKAAQVRG